MDKFVHAVTLQRNRNGIEFNPDNVYSTFMLLRVPIKHMFALFRISIPAILLMIGIVGCANQLKPLEPVSPPTPSPTPRPSPSPSVVEPLHTPPAVKSKLPKIQYTIQVGAFTTPGRAARYAEKLQAAGLDAYYFIDSDGLSKVRFEGFETWEAAYRRASALKSQGLIANFIIAQPPSAHTMPEGSISEPSADLQAALVNTARRFVGSAYRWGGSTTRQGFDCSGLTMTVYRLNGLDLPRSSYDQYRDGTPVARNELKGGDLVFFATNGGHRVSHVGIYSGQGRFIHAPGRGKYIRSASLSDPYFKSRYVGARRYY